MFIKLGYKISKHRCRSKLWNGVARQGWHLRYIWAFERFLAQNFKATVLWLTVYWYTLDPHKMAMIPAVSNRLITWGIFRMAVQRIFEGKHMETELYRVQGEFEEWRDLDFNVSSKPQNDSAKVSCKPLNMFEWIWDVKHLQTGEGRARHTADQQLCSNPQPMVRVNGHCGGSFSNENPIGGALVSNTLVLFQHVSTFKLIFLSLKKNICFFVYETSLVPRSALLIKVWLWTPKMQRLTWMSFDATYFWFWRSRLQELQQMAMTQPVSRSWCG